ncbi:hypothetical protein [Nitratireductor alexandrii]|uniref:hypothetical protein n=1 Tax=Nitratireductor alexandrii TaxID=2448161 RepID=UPI000FDB1BFA|nr:hypothetical protein [Nitratireductor alexandrii]
MIRNASKALSCLTGFLLLSVLTVPAFAGEIVERPGERPREMPNICSQHPDDPYFGSFRGIGQKGMFRDQMIFEAGCFASKARCEAWLYAIRSDHSAGEKSAYCKPR